MANNPYTAYKNRLFGKLQEQPELRMMNQAIASRSMPYNQLNNQLQSMLQQTNASAGARIAAAHRGQMQLQDERQGLYSQALDAQAQRADTLGDRLAEVSAKEQEWQDSYDEQQAQKKTQALRAGLQVLGTGIGMAAGNPALGYQIGSLASGVVGIDKGGKLTAKPEQWDTGQILNSAVAIGGEYMKHVDSKDFQKNTEEMMTMYKSEEFTKMLEGMSSAQQAQFIGLMQWEMMQNKGKSPYALSLYEAHNGGGSAPGIVSKDPPVTSTIPPVQGNATGGAPGESVIATNAEAPTRTTVASGSASLFSNSAATRFSNSLAGDKNKAAYMGMYSELATSFRGNAQDPKFKAWVEKKYPAKGTYNKFLRLWEASK